MTDKQRIAILYHSVFNFTLSKEELKKWEAGPKLVLKKRTKKLKVITKKTIDHENLRKLQIAQKATSLLSKIPTIKFIGITGSLAMNNAKTESDIDLMVITKANTLWVSRIAAYILLKIKKIELRSPKVKDEKDKVCLNLWLDENDLVWGEVKNAYIAHEISQVIPLLNKGKTYEKWISLNLWIFDYWPKAVDIKTTKNRKNRKTNPILVVLNVLLYLLQRVYMNSKITRENVSLTHAFFHPYDWGEKVMKELKAKGIFEV